MRLQLHEWGERTAPPVVALHGIGGHGRRFRKLAEERLAETYRVLAPDLRGHGFSGWDPPWSIATHVADLLETMDAAGVDRAVFIGHSYGGRLVLELAALEHERLQRAILLDPAIDLLPHVGYDFAELELLDHTFAERDEAVLERLRTGPTTPREFVEEDAREHLAEGPDGLLRYRYCRGAVVTGYGELCSPPPPPETLRVPALLLHAERFGLVRDEQIDAYRAALGDRLEVTAVPGGHMVFWDAWDATADAVVRFLARS